MRPISSVQKRRRKRHYGERERPFETFSVDENGVADPPEAGDEIAEAEPPAHVEGWPQTPERAASGLSRRAVEQPDQNRKGNKARGEKVERSLGKDREGSGDKSERGAPPTPEQYDLACKALHTFRPSRIT
jgi:hypothetical protein